MTLLDIAILESTPGFRDPGDMWAATRRADEKFRVLRELTYEIGQLRVATAPGSDAYPVPSKGA